MEGEIVNKPELEIGTENDEYEDDPQGAILSFWPLVGDVILPITLEDRHGPITSIRITGSQAKKIVEHLTRVFPL